MNAFDVKREKSVGRVGATKQGGVSRKRDRWLIGPMFPRSRGALWLGSFAPSSPLPQRIKPLVGTRAFSLETP